MSWQAVVGAIVGTGAAAVATTLTIVREWSARGGETARIKQRIELLNGLPADSPARARLLEHIEAAVLSLVDREETATRDLQGIVIGVALLAGGVAIALALAYRWWTWTLGAFVGGMGVYGLSLSLGKAQRDSRGNRIGSVQAEVQAQVAAAVDRLRPSRARTSTPHGSRTEGPTPP